MRFLAYVLPLVAAVYAASGDMDPVNILLEGRSFTVPFLNTSLSGTSLQLYNLTIDNLALLDTTITHQSTPDYFTLNLTLVPLTGNASFTYGSLPGNGTVLLSVDDTAHFHLGMDIRKSDLNVTLNFCNVTLGNIWSWADGPLYFYFSQPMLNNLVQLVCNPTMLTGLLRKVHFPTPDPYAIAKKEESSLPHIPYFNLSASKGVETFERIVNEVLAAENSTTHKTAIGEIFDRKDLFPHDPLPTINVTIDSPVVTSETINITLGTLEFLGLDTVGIHMETIGNYSLLLSIPFKSLSAKVSMDMTLRSLAGESVSTHAMLDLSKSSNLRLNVSLLMGANTTRFLNLPVGRLVTLKELSKCGLYPFDIFNVSTFTLEFSELLLTVDAFNKVLSEDVNSLLAMAVDLFGSSFPGMLQKTVGLINKALAKGLDNPVCASPPAPPAHAPKYLEFNNSKVVKAVDWVVDGVMGTTGDLNINKFLSYVDLSSIARKSWVHTYDSDMVGHLVVGIDNIRARMPEVTQLDILRPAGVYSTDNRVAFDKVNVSADLYFSVSGSQQSSPFHDNFTVSVDIQKLQSAMQLMAKVNRGDLFRTTLEDMKHRPGCALGLMIDPTDGLRIPSLNMSLEQMGFGVQCHDCQSPRMGELERALADPKGIEQITKAMNKLFGKLTPFLNSQRTTSTIDGWMADLPELCKNGPDLPKSRSGGPMTNAKAYAIIWGISGGLALVLLIVTPILHKREMERIVEEERDGELVKRDTTILPLFQHPAIPRAWRYGMLFCLLGTIACFFTSNLPPYGTGATVHALVTFAGSKMNVEDIFTYALANTIRDMWNGQVYPLSLLVLVLSGIWPYSKMVLLVWVWLCPPTVMGHKTRGRIIHVLDLLGKWSLIDSFLMIMMMVAFRLHLFNPTYLTFLPTDIVMMDVIVTPHWGLYGFMTAAILSLTLNHIMMVNHRNALEYDETAGASQGWFDDVAEEFKEEKETLAFHSLPSMSVDEVARHRVKSVLVIVLLVLSLALLIWGSSVHTFAFEFEGLAAMAVNLDKANTAKSEYSLFSLARNVFDQAPLDDEAAIYYLAIAFLIFAFIMPVLQVIFLMVLWLYPMTLRMQKIFFFINEIIAAWCALEVFVIVLIACLLEISKFALYLIGDKCDLINYGLTEIFEPLGLLDVAPKCFDVKATLLSGCWILFASAVVSNIAYQVAWREADSAIDRRHAHQEEISPLNAVNKSDYADVEH